MRDRRTARAALALIVGLALILVGTTRLRRPSPEVAIRAAIAQFEHGLDAGSAQEALGAISKRFEGQGLTYTDVARGLFDLCRSSSRVHLYVDRVEIDVADNGRTADIVAHVAFYGSGAFGEFNYGQDRPVPVRATFAREGRHWRAVSCEGFPTVPGYWF